MPANRFNGYTNLGVGIGLRIPHYVAGHSKFEKYVLDTHDHPVLAPVWRLYARAIELCGPTNTLLEWDAHIPSFEEVHSEALKARRFIGQVAAGGLTHDSVAIA